jgi:hypothetical protein
MHSSATFLPATPMDIMTTYHSFGRMPPRRTTPPDAVIPPIIRICPGALIGLPIPRAGKEIGFQASHEWASDELVMRGRLQGIPNTEVKPCRADGTAAFLSLIWL